MVNEKVIEAIEQKRTLCQRKVTWKIVAKFYCHLFPSFIKGGEISIDDTKFITNAILFGLFLGGLLFMTPDFFKLVLIFSN